MEIKDFIAQLKTRPKVSLADGALCNGFDTRRCLGSKKAVVLDDLLIPLYIVDRLRYFKDGEVVILPSADKDLQHTTLYDDVLGGIMFVDGLKYHYQFKLAPAMYSFEYRRRLNPA